MTEKLLPANSETDSLRASILEYAGANNALDELCLHGIDREVFLELLVLSARVLSPTEVERQPAWEIPGIPCRRLIKFSARLEGLADELQRIDSQPFVKNSYPMVAVTNTNEFDRLPDLLRERAYTLRLQVVVNRVVHSQISRAMERQARLSLVEYVRQWSVEHRPMYPEVALLLTAALYAVGRNEEVSPESLRTLWHDDKQRSESLETST